MQYRLFAIALFFLLPGLAHAASVTTSIGFGTESNSGNVSSVLQSFIAPTNNMNGVSLRFNGGPFSASASVSLYEDEAMTSLLGSESKTVFDGSNSFSWDAAATNIGSTYYLYVDIDPNQQFIATATFVSNTVDSYTGGNILNPTDPGLAKWTYRDLVDVKVSYDDAFDEIPRLSEVPLPAGFGLLFAGLAALGFAGKRGRRSP